MKSQSSLSSAATRRNVSFSADMPTRLQIRKDDGLGDDLSMGYCFQVPGGIVNDDQDVFVAVGALGQLPR